MSRRKSKFQKHKEEIKYHLINSLIAGLLVFAGSMADGSITKAGLIATFGASAVVALIKFKDYWEKEKKTYSKTILNFL